jgi:hypothetical protein
MAKKKGSVLSKLPIGGKLFPTSSKDLKKAGAWNNYANPLSPKSLEAGKQFLDMRAGPSGTSSVGRDREKKEAYLAQVAADAQQKAAAQAAFEAKYPGGVGAPRTFPGGSSGVPPWATPGGYNPALRLRGQPDPFAQALTPTPL